MIFFMETYLPFEDELADPPRAPLVAGVKKG